jgi:MgsA AAA+ ATPase C terminal
MDGDVFQALLCYPEHQWGISACQKWQLLTNSLLTYLAPARVFKLDEVRKWELVSAFQKSIRRADRATALHLVSAMHSMPREHGYFWRRLCVIACEDVGPADDTLAKFVVACATLFAPKRTGEENYRLWCFLVEQMCALPFRSRIYCSYGILDAASAAAELPKLTDSDARIIASIVERKREVVTSAEPWRQWQRKNDWRAEGLLRFVDMPHPTRLTINDTPIPAHKMLFDLPSFASDMHTRVGLEMLHRLARGVPGAEAIRDLLNRYQVKSAHRAVGSALFFVEGGRIRSELVWEPLSSLEQRFFAHKYGLPLEAWWKLRSLVQSALEIGMVDRLREEILTCRYGQKELDLVCQR